MTQETADSFIGKKVTFFTYSLGNTFKVNSIPIKARLWREGRYLVSFQDLGEFEVDASILYLENDPEIINIQVQ